jgi:hypothetical protein
LGAGEAGNCRALRKGEHPYYTKSSCKTIRKGNDLAIKSVLHKGDLQRVMHLCTQVPLSSNQGNAQKSYSDGVFTYQTGRWQQQEKERWTTLGAGRAWGRRHSGSVLKA